MGGPWSSLDWTGGLARQPSNDGESAQPGHWTAGDRPVYDGDAFLKTVEDNN